MGIQSRRWHAWILGAAVAAGGCSSASGGGGGTGVGKDGGSVKFDVSFGDGAKGSGDGGDGGPAGGDGPSAEGDVDASGAPSDGSAGDGSEGPDIPGFFDDDTAADTADGGAACAAGELVCQGLTAATCDGNGGFTASELCPDACAPGLGCVKCLPGSMTCDATSAQKCLDDGSGFVDALCDAELGFVCDAGTGQCTGPCAETITGRSYIGCEYWPTVTSNAKLFNGFSFAVVVANTAADAATITIRRGAKVVATASVAAGSVQTVKLPWVMALKHDTTNLQSAAQFNAEMTSGLVTDGAYQLKSTRPVTVYQFNPLDFEIAAPPGGGCYDPYSTGKCDSYSNDASMLLPTNSLGKEYYVASMPASGTKDGLSTPGFVAITATADGTSVTVDAKGAVRAGPGVSAIAVNGSKTFNLDQGDVLQLLTATPPNSAMSGCKTQVNGAVFCQVASGYDLTGSKITASAPVAVIGGHDCTNVPYDKFACDHVEESLFPLKTWGSSVIVTPPQGVSGAKTANGVADVQYVRVISGVAGNTVTFSPASVQAAKTLGAGEFVDLKLSKENFVVSGSGPLMVAQLMAGGDQVDPINSGTPNSKGDPSLSLAVPSAQFRKQYVFLTPSTYTYSFANVIAASAETVTLDGKDIPAKAFSPVGNSGYGVARVKVGGGSHTITAASGFGLVVYGYAAYTSYMYPGGLDLNVVP